jgi:hypothetical protein
MQTIERNKVAMNARGGWVAYPECGGFRYELGGCQGCSDQGGVDRAAVICLQRHLQGDLHAQILCHPAILILYVLHLCKEDWLPSCTLGATSCQSRTAMTHFPLS